VISVVGAAVMFIALLKLVGALRISNVFV